MSDERKRHVVSVDLGDELGQWLEGEITRLRTESPGARWNRSDAVRAALYELLSRRTADAAPAA